MENILLAIVLAATSEVVLTQTSSGNGTRWIGYTGATGKMGATGPWGRMGDKGRYGPTGRRGDTGPTGPIGSNGPDAGSAATGDTGATGPMGTGVGPTGERGVVGLVKGETGPPGLQGAPGKNCPYDGPLSFVKPLWDLILTVWFVALSSFVVLKRRQCLNQLKHAKALP